MTKIVMVYTIVTHINCTSIPYYVLLTPKLTGFVQNVTCDFCTHSPVDT